MQSLLNLLQIRRNEVGLVALVAGLFMVMGAGPAFGVNASNALFFSRLGVDLLPYMYIASGVGNFAFSMAYAIGVNRLGKRTFFWTVPFIFAVLLLVQWLLLAVEFQLLYPIIWLTVGISGLIGGLIAWNMAGQLFNTRRPSVSFRCLAAQIFSAAC